MWTIREGEKGQAIGVKWMRQLPPIPFFLPASGESCERRVEGHSEQPNCSGTQAWGKATQSRARVPGVEHALRALLQCFDSSEMMLILSFQC